jgi:DNA-dependent RNA polymerase auxiliary subunit epsilon
MSTISGDASALNIQPNEYIAFDATNIRDFMRNRLTQSGLFTDQYLEGSNLTAITNIIAYSFHTFMYYLNKTSSESMFSESQIYENINRVVKLINYSPIGKQTATLTYTCSATSDLGIGSYTIPRYSFVRIGNAPYSFNQDVTFTVTLSTGQYLENVGNQSLLYQGKWTEYPLYYALGVTNETVFVAPGSAVNVDHFNIDVYVQSIATGTWSQWNRTESLYLENATAKKFEVRLNESQNYELKFGDGINGAQLNPGDVVAVYYLQSLGIDGEVAANTITGLPAVIYSTAQFSNIQADVFSPDLTYLTDSNITGLRFDNANPSTAFTNAENADSIRKNAPAAFKSQYRLVTPQDYQNYITSTFGNIIQDATVYSNNDYVNNHLRYLYNIGLTNPNQDNRVLYNQLAFATSCNFNNVYIYALPKATQQNTGSSINYLTPAQKSLIINTAADKKTLTSDIIVMDPVYKAVTVGYGSNTDTDLNAITSQTRLVVVLDRTAKISTQLIQNQVTGIVQAFFDPTKLTLGYNIDTINLTAQIESIPGVSNVYTQRLDTGAFVQGVSLVIWNPSYPNNDISITSKPYQLTDFQALYFNNINDFSSRIIVSTDVSQDTSVITI